MNSGQDLRQSSYLRHVSRSYAAASAALPPALPNRAALIATQHHNQHTSAAPVSFAARAALLADSSNSQASLDMFRRLSGTHQPRPKGGGKHDRLPPRPTDSARQSEAGGGGSLLDLLDEGWSGPQPAPSTAHAPYQQRAAAATTASTPATTARPPSGQLTPTSALESSSSFAFDYDRQPHSAGSPHAAATSAYSTATSGSGYGGAGLHVGIALAAEDEEAAAGFGGGCDTPRSAVSWTSCLSTALPQTEAELQQLDYKEVERLAEDAADLQWRAATALRLARQRMNLGAAGIAQGPSKGFQAGFTREGPVRDLEFPAGTREDAHPLPAPGSSRSPATEAGRTRQPLHTSISRRRAADTQEGHGFLRLYLLLLAVAEVVLLWLAQLARCASLGVLHPPRSLVLAPVTAARSAVCLVLFVSDAARQALAALGRSPTSSFS